MLGGYGLFTYLNLLVQLMALMMTASRGPIAGTRCRFGVYEHHRRYLDGPISTPAVALVVRRRSGSASASLGGLRPIGYFRRSAAVGIRGVVSVSGWSSGKWPGRLLLIGPSLAMVQKMLVMPWRILLIWLR